MNFLVGGMQAAVSLLAMLAGESEELKSTRLKMAQVEKHCSRLSILD